MYAADEAFITFRQTLCAIEKIPMLQLPMRAVEITTGLRRGYTLQEQARMDANKGQQGARTPDSDP